MTTEVLNTLYEHYPTVIAQMPDEFTSHQFILKLAQQHQDLYIEALYHYRHNPANSTPTPFMIVHGILAKRLAEYTDLIEQSGANVPSENIWREKDTCAGWRKL